MFLSTICSDEKISKIVPSLTHIALLLDKEAFRQATNVIHRPTTTVASSSPLSQLSGAKSTLGAHDASSSSARNLPTPSRPHSATVSGASMSPTHATTPTSPTSGVAAASSLTKKSSFAKLVQRVRSKSASPALQDTDASANSKL